MKSTLVAAFLLGASIMATPDASAAEKADLPFGMLSDHINLVLSATDPDKVNEFYGDVLGLKRIPDIPFPGDVYMIRYLGAESEIKFIIMGQELPSLSGPTAEARGVRLMALKFPAERREPIVAALKEKGYTVPEFNESPRLAYGMTFDGDGNQVELIFYKGDVSEETLNEFQIGMTIGNLDAMDTFMRDILGLEEMEPVDLGGGFMKHNFRLGKTVLKYWSLGDELPIKVGGPMEFTGMNLIQFIVPNVDAVREQVLARGGKIAREPFALGTLATIMFVEGPDGTLFEFAGPLLERLKGK